jgi:hypothetical protein
MAYQMINEQLRGGSVNPENEALVANIQSAIDKGRTDEDVVVFRGMRIGASDLRALSPGDVFNDKAFVSTSLQRNVATTFASGGSNSAVVQISLPAGSRCVGIAGGESEVLLSANSSFRFDGVDTSSGQRVFKMTYIGTDPHNTGTLSKSLSDGAPASKFEWRDGDITIIRRGGVRKYSDDQPRDDHGRWGSGEGEGTVKAEALKFMQGHLDAFKAAGGTIRNVGVNSAACRELLEQAQGMKSVLQSADQRTREGAAYTIDALSDFGYADKRVLVAVTADGVVAAALDFRKSSDSLDINELGSMRLLPGAATALEVELATLAAKSGLQVDSTATGDAVPYHQLIGRTMPGVKAGDEVNPDNGRLYESYWTKEQCAEIARTVKQ